MGLSGQELGVQLATLYKAGYSELPAVADDYRTAAVSTPQSASPATRRPSGIGADPGPQIDEMLGLLDKAVRQTEEAIRDVGQALVWCANHYAETDEAARRTFERRTADLEDVG